MSNVSETIGDNKEFTVTDISDVTIHFGTDNTSANDTATNKYFDNHPYIGVKAFCLRPDQTVEIVSFNGVELTDPYTAVVDKGITEKLDAPFLFKMVIRTTVANTHIKLRIR